MNFLHFHVLYSKQQMFNQVELKMLVLTCSYFSVSAYIRFSDIHKLVFLCLVKTIKLRFYFLKGN